MCCCHCFWLRLLRGRLLGCCLKRRCGDEQQRQHRLRHCRWHLQQQQHRCHFAHPYLIATTAKRPKPMETKPTQGGGEEPPRKLRASPLRSALLAMKTERPQQQEEEHRRYCCCCALLLLLLFLLPRMLASVSLPRFPVHLGGCWSWKRRRVGAGLGTRRLLRQWWGWWAPTPGGGAGAGRTRC